MSAHLQIDKIESLLRHFEDDADSLRITRPKGTILSKRSLLLESNVMSEYAGSSSYDSLMHLAKNFTLKGAFALINKNARALCNSLLLFTLGPKVIISYVNFDVLPKTAYLTLHHRHSLYHVECFSQFIFSKNFNDHSVLTSIGRQCGKESFFNNVFENIVKKIGTYVFGSLSILNQSSEERYWSIVKNMTEGQAMSVFVCRESSQYFGDREFYFRDGVYAASLFTGVPILDFVIVEPTASRQYMTIDIIKIEPPEMPKNTVTNAVTTANEYLEWRIKNEERIYNFTQDTEKIHKARLDEVENAAASCYVNEEQAFCEINQIMLRDIKRNQSYVSYRDLKRPQTKKTAYK